MELARAMAQGGVGVGVEGSPEAQSLEANVPRSDDKTVAVCSAEKVPGTLGSPQVKSTLPLLWAL